MPRVLTPAQQIVLEQTFVEHKLSKEIARELNTTANNVDQIRRRGLRRLYRALTSTRKTSGEPRKR
jgi:DNA-directed RNA polymerase specialized sigma24 family protein